MSPMGIHTESKEKEGAPDETVLYSYTFTSQNIQICIYE